MHQSNPSAPKLTLSSAAGIGLDITDPHLIQYVTNCHASNTAAVTQHFLYAQQIHLNVEAMIGLYCDTRNADNAING